MHSIRPVGNDGSRSSPASAPAPIAVAQKARTAGRSIGSTPSTRKVSVVPGSNASGNGGGVVSIPARNDATACTDGSPVAVAQASTISANAARCCWTRAGLSPSVAIPSA